MFSTSQSWSLEETECDLKCIGELAAALDLLIHVIHTVSHSGQQRWERACEAIVWAVQRCEETLPSKWETFINLCILIQSDIYTVLYDLQSSFILFVMTSNSTSSSLCPLLNDLANKTMGHQSLERFACSSIKKWTLHLGTGGVELELRVAWQILSV